METWQANQKKRKASDHTAGSVLRKVPDTFHNVDDYLDVFESLLLEECRSQILRGDEEEGLLYECTYISVDPQET